MTVGLAEGGPADPLRLIEGEVGIDRGVVAGRTAEGGTLVMNDDKEEWGSAATLALAPRGRSSARGRRSACAIATSSALAPGPMTTPVGRNGDFAGSSKGRSS